MRYDTTRVRHASSHINTLPVLGLQRAQRVGRCTRGTATQK